MERIKLDKDIRPLSEFRANVAAFIDEIQKTKRPLVITKRGKSAAIVLDVSEYEALLSKVDLLSDIYTAEKQLESGNFMDHDEAKREVLKRIRK